MFQSLKTAFIEWITHESPTEGFPLCDFERIRYEIRPCDVLLIEGRSHASNVIKLITQSSWSHACLYVGRIYDVDDIELRNRLTEHFGDSPNHQLVIEGYMGKGTIVSRLENYRQDHIRICRPRGLSRKDAQKVIAYAILKLGTDYNTRQIFDLARFMVPWSIMPGRWRSSLFSKHAGESTKTVCSTMIAEAFASVEFPILPLIKQHEETGIELIHRNPKLFTPRDFDYSPFFEIIKYPFIELSELAPYRNLPWNRSGLVSPDGLNIVEEKPHVKEEIQEKVQEKFEEKEDESKLEDIDIVDKGDTDNQQSIPEISSDNHEPLEETPTQISTEEGSKIDQTDPPPENEGKKKTLNNTQSTIAITASQSLFTKIASSHPIKMLNDTKKNQCK